MLSSIQTSAHVFALAEIDMSRVIAAKNADAPHAEKAGLKLTFMPYVIAAIARALGDHPELNASVSGDALILRAEKNIGVAVDTKEGLVVPVIRRANELGLLGIARQLAELSERAKTGKLSADDISGGSFTISNPGKDGNLVGLSIIRQPEVAILRMGSIVKRAVVREIEGEDVIVVRPMMFAALSYDHRVIDGRAGNAFLSAVSDLIAKTRPALGA
jgi:2-oxoglutarate dehydrogenase E2 component (dihydrolipoamide succinyltransferase)